MAHTITLPVDAAKAVGMVGQVVTYGNRQFHVHCVEGRHFFAFQNAQGVTVDTEMTYADWLNLPVATLVPMGHKIGDGVSIEAPADRIKRGVCLIKEGE